MVLHGRGARPLMLAPAACGGVWGRVASEDERPERPHERRPRSRFNFFYFDHQSSKTMFYAFSYPGTLTRHPNQDHFLTLEVLSWQPHNPTLSWSWRMARYGRRAFFFIFGTWGCGEEHSEQTCCSCRSV